MAAIEGLKTREFSEGKQNYCFIFVQDLENIIQQSCWSLVNTLTNGSILQENVSKMKQPPDHSDEGKKGEIINRRGWKNTNKAIINNLFLLINFYPLFFFRQFEIFPDSFVWIITFIVIITNMQLSVFGFKFPLFPFVFSDFLLQRFRFFLPFDVLQIPFFLEQSLLF